MSDEVQGQQPPPDLPPPSAEEIVTTQVVESIIKGYNEDNELVDFCAELGTKMGDNYMSIMYAVDISMKNRKTGVKEKINVMLKTMPRNAIRQQMINDSAAFVKDANIYKEIIPRMEAFQKEKGLGDKEMFTGWPKCYTTFIDGATDYLCMEDLRVSGYKMANRLTGLDIEHTHLVLKSIAHFHAISFAIFGGDPSAIMEAYPWLEEKMFPPIDKVQDQMKLWLVELMKNEAEMVRKEGFLKEADLLANICTDEGKFFTYMNQLLAGSVKNVVINHGDCWTNNMLFSYDEAGKVEGLKFVDFQLARCAPRSIDLAYFLHSSVPIVNLNTKEEAFLRVYFDEFNTYLGKLGVDVSAFDLSWDNFMEEYGVCKFYGVVMGLMLAPMLSADSKDIPDMNTLTENDMTEDGVKDFMAQLMGPSTASTKKICNLAVNHLTKCKMPA